MNSAFSLDLRLALAGFVSGLISGRFRSAQALATALDKLSDLAWEEAEELIPPGSRFD